MNAKEYLEANNPMTLDLIKAYIPAKINLAMILEKYHQAKSEEEAKERYRAMIKEMDGDHFYYKLRSIAWGDKEVRDALNKALRLAAFGKEGEG